MWSGSIDWGVGLSVGCWDGFVGCVAFFVVRLSLEDPLRHADSAPPPHAGEGACAVALVLCMFDFACGGCDPRLSLWAWSEARDLAVGRDPLLAQGALLETLFESIDWLSVVVWNAIILVPLFPLM